MKKMNWLWIVPFLSLHLFFTTLSTNSHPPEIRSPAPSPWPEQFHALLYMNLSKGQLQISDLWYDWPRGRNVNLMQKQLGVLLYDVEWNNGTSFYYTVGEDATCSVMEFGVGIPRRNFLDGAVYLGTAATDGFLCNVWEKIDFIWYYEDVDTKVPVRWDFYDGISTHVITFEVGATLDDSVTQAPSYCFTDVGNQRKTELKHRRNSKIGDFLHPRS